MRKRQFIGAGAMLAGSAILNACVIDADDDDDDDDDRPRRRRRRWRRYYLDDNPSGPQGGPGTNWENPPGPRGGPVASPDRGF